MGKFIVKRVNTTRAAATSTCWRKKISRYNSVQEYVIRRIRLSIKDKERERGVVSSRNMKGLPPSFSSSLAKLYAEGIKERNESCGACMYYNPEWFDVLVTRVLRPVS